MSICTKTKCWVNILDHTWIIFHLKKRKTCPQSCWKLKLFILVCFERENKSLSYSPFLKLLLEKLNIEPLQGCKRSQERLWFNTGSLVLLLHLNTTVSKWLYSPAIKRGKMADKYEHCNEAGLAKQPCVSLVNILFNKDWAQTSSMTHVIILQAFHPEKLSSPDIFISLCLIISNRERKGLVWIAVSCKPEWPQSSATKDYLKLLIFLPVSQLP